MPGRHPLPRRAEERAKMIAAVFIAALLGADRKGHLRGGDSLIQIIHQRRKVGIGPRVENNEARINGDGACAGFDGHSMGMAANAVVSFNQGHIMTLRQSPGARQAGDTAADNGNFQLRQSCKLRDNS